MYQIIIIFLIFLTCLLNLNSPYLEAVNECVITNIIHHLKVESQQSRLLLVTLTAQQSQCSYILDCGPAQNFQQLDRDWKIKFFTRSLQLLGYLFFSLLFLKGPKTLVRFVEGPQHRIYIIFNYDTIG